MNGLDNYQVTDIAWNSKGSQIAVAYGKTDHVTWCEHESIVAIWSIFRSDFNPKKAHLEIEVNNCLTSVAFHPLDPLILAGGTMNGEIFIWNIGYLIHFFPYCIFKFWSNKPNNSFKFLETFRLNILLE